MAHDWPGNIRELENVIERSFILCGKDQIGISHLPEELTAHGTVRSSSSKIRMARDLLDTHAIRIALEKNSYNRLAAAAELGIHKSTLFRKMKKLGISLPQENGRSRRLQKQ
jgi:transcriptional regulator with PAS, ATPase and Fis domain